MLPETVAAIVEFMQSSMDTVYPEPPSAIHGEIIRRMVPVFLEKSGLKSGRVLDVGCGQGEALIEFGKHGLTAHGITTGHEDYAACRSKGLECWMVDMHDIGSFFAPQEYDAIWLRHSAEHSPIPLFLLIQAKRLLKHGGHLYFEVPMPETSCQHEENPNHYSVMTESGWLGLLRKAGFTPTETRKFGLETQAGPDSYCAIFAQKAG